LALSGTPVFETTTAKPARVMAVDDALNVLLSETWNSYIRGPFGWSVVPFFTVSVGRSVSSC